MGILAICLFVFIFVLIMKGYPVAFTIGGVSVLFGVLLAVFAPETFQMVDFNILASRLMGILKNPTLMAVPLFVFMGIMLEKSGLAEQLLETMALLFGHIRGGLAISVVIVGTMLAASTGIVGATVVTMGLISLPTMLKRGYSPELATGTIAASGTLGQIIPPSVVLVLLADTMNNASRGESLDVGMLFKAAMLPGILLSVCYIIYIIIFSLLRPELAPAMPREEVIAFRGKGFLMKVLSAFLLPMLLIVAVLGAIFFGIATPTEAAAVGAVGALLLTLFQGKLSLKVLQQVGAETTHLTSMVFFVLFGATVFSFMFRWLGGDAYLVQLIEASNLSPMLFLLLVMLVVFIAGFFIDFIEIIFIVVPVVTPIFNTLGIDLTWVAILLAVNLQTSFLTPPFGFSLFYLKGVAPPSVTTNHLYRGIVPFVLIQVIFLIILIFFPSIIM